MQKNPPRTILEATTLASEEESMSEEVTNAHPFDIHHRF
jgi:hypothetical protein